MQTPRPQALVMPADQRHIGLIAGNGHFPILFARAARAQGVRVTAVAMRGETLPELTPEVDAITWLRVGQLGKMLKVFETAGVKQAAMAGGVRKTRLFEGARPDMLTLKLLARCTVRRDDGMLRAIAAEYEKRGIEIVPSTHFMPEFLAPEGVLTQRLPTDEQWHDLAYGFRIARTVGNLDIGQSVVVHAGAVVALEAIEGTDACIERAGQLIGGHGGTLVKVAKPVQDMRFDVPAIGRRTILNAHKAGLRTIGLEAAGTLLLDPQGIMEEADRCGIALVGLSPAGAPHQSTSAEEASCRKSA